MDYQPVSDADRDHVIAALQRSRASGHIDQATLTDRMQIAVATQDPLQLYGLLNDLPDLSTATWTPTPDQQLIPFQDRPASTPMPAPYEPAPTKPAWQEFLGKYWWAIALAMMVLGLFVTFMFVGNSSGFGWWWWIIFIVIFSRRGMRMRGNTPPPPPGNWRPSQPPPQTQDRFDSDDDSGRDGQWHQPPR